MKVSIAMATSVAALANAFNTQLNIEPRASVPTVTVKGNAFFAGSDRFYIRGVDYQPGGSSGMADPIADVEGCRRDVAKFKKLGINTVRVYTVDNTADHDECMSMLADAGIYLALDVNTPKYSINRGDPGPSYNPTYLQSIFATIDAFAKYDNTLLFFSGNEVINSNDTTQCAPYIKAVTRDMKQYINSQGYRKIPVGYSAADVANNRYEQATYLNCGTDDERSDFFAFNDYSWCDPSSYTISGWDQKVQQYSDYGIPLFLSEYGCITNDREFGEVAALYGSDMTPVYSGGLVYEYSEEGSGYGLVQINGDSVTETSDFSAIQKALSGTVPTGDGGYRQDGSPSTCPAQSSAWEVTGDDLPSLPSGAEQYMTEGAGTGPGLSGSGSQTAGDGTPSTSGTVTATTDEDVESGSATASASTSASAAASSGAQPRGAAISSALALCGGLVAASVLM